MAWHSCHCRTRVSAVVRVVPETRLFVRMSNDFELCLFSRAKPAAKRKKNVTKEPRACKNSRTEGSGAREQSRDVAAAETDALSLPSQVPESSEFSDIGLSEHLSNVCSALGMSRPTPVQVWGSRADSLTLACARLILEATVHIDGSS